MSYDPDPRRRRRRRRTHDPARRGRVPPQLRAWVFGRRRKRYDPGKADHKRYGVGKRRGVYWGGGRKKRRYDPERFARVRRYGRRIGGKFEGFINRYGGWIGGLVALAAGVGIGINKYVAAREKAGDTDTVNKALHNYWVTTIGGTRSDGRVRPPEISHLWQNDPPEGGGYTPITYLQTKFLNTDSCWFFPFWGSLIGLIASKLPLPFRSWNRIRKPLGKISAPALVVSTIGALALPGCPDEASTPTNPTAPRLTSTLNVSVHN